MTMGMKKGEESHAQGRKLVAASKGHHTCFHKGIKGRRNKPTSKRKNSPVQE
jgi:hypothetical protein